MTRLLSSFALRFSVLSFSFVSGIAALLGANLYLAFSAEVREEVVPIRAAKRGNPWINFQDGRESSARYSTREGMSASTALLKQAEPLSLASDDLNGDSLPDLVCGYRSGTSGLVTLRFGNPGAYSPKDPETIQGIIKGQYPDPFLPDAVVLRANQAPDFLALGDFNGDRQLDIVVAARGSDSLELLAGNGSLEFLPSRTLGLPGRITTMLAGDLNTADPLKDLMIGIAGNGGPAALVYQGATGGLTGEAVPYPLPGEASAMAIGRLDDDAAIDLAVVAGGKIVIIHGQEQRSSRIFDEGFEETLGRMDQVVLPFAVKAIAVSDFIWDRDSRMEIAVVADDCTVRILRRGELDTRAHSAAEARTRRRIAFEARENARPAPIRRLIRAMKWELAETIPVAIDGAGDRVQPLLMSTLASGQKSYDLLIVNATARQLQIAMREDTMPGTVEQPGQTTRKTFAFDTDAEPVAVLPMRLNLHARPGIVTLGRGKVEPSYIMSAPLATFTVTKTADTNVSCAMDNCSLREAVVAANAARGAHMIVFAAGLNTLPIQLTIAGDDNLAATGDLDINTDVTILGNGAANTIIQGSNDAAFAGNMGDKVFGINQSGTFQTLNVTISGLTVRFARNQNPVAGTFTETGGAMDIFLSGTGAMPGPTTTISDCVFSNNANANSYGGAINVDSGDLMGGTNVFRGSVQVTNTTISNNSTQNMGAAVTGGGVNLFADRHNVTFTNSTITANTTAANIAASGGGLNVRHSFGGTVTLNNTSVTGNTSGSDGGGILIAEVGGQTFNMTGGSISANTALGTGGSANGGGMFNASPVGGTTLSGVAIDNNIATAGTNARGGGIYDGANTPMTISDCHIGGNSSDNGGGVATTKSSATEQTVIMNSTIIGNSASTAGGALFALSGVMNAGLNRIVNNSAPSGSGIAQTGGTANVENNWWACDGFPGAVGCQTGSGTFDADPRIDLKVTAAPAMVSVGGTSTITASFATNSANAAINPTVMNGLNVSWSGTNGTMSPTVGTITALTATSTFTSTGCANGMASATVDNGTDSAAITFIKSNTTTTITADAPDPTVVGQSYNVSFTVAGTSGTPTGNVTVSDGTSSCMGTVAAGGCALTSLSPGLKTLTATYPDDACFNASTSAGVSHQVNKADTTTTITADAPDPSVPVQNVTVEFTVAAAPPGAGTPTGNVMVTVSGGSETCTGTVAAGNCVLALTSAGMRTLTAAYVGDANFNTSSDTETHQVNKADTTTTITADMPDPTVEGLNVTVAYSVSVVLPGVGTPTGNVTVTVSGGSETCTGTVAAGSCVLALTSTGMRTLTATYAGDANFSGSFDTEAHQVDTNCVLTCPANITVSNAPGECGANVTYPDPSFTGNCGTVTCLPLSGSFFNKGATTVNCTTAAGPSCSFTVTVNDTEPPAITCPANIAVVSTTPRVVNYTPPAGRDNCTGQTTAQTAGLASGATFPLGLTNNTFDVTDADGRKASCSFTVAVEPVTASITDPFGCTGPGDPMTVTLQVQNASGVPQSGSASASVGAGLLALADTCTSTAGTCNVVNASTVAWSGTLAPGEVVTINYQVQVADGAAPGIQLCIDSTATLGASPPVSVTACAAVNCPAVGPGDPFAGSTVASDQRAGSILIYNLYSSSGSMPSTQNTTMSITNTDPSRAIAMHLFFIDGESCSVAGRFTCLTPQQTVSFLASEFDPGVTGYLMVIAVDPITGCPISFNHLVGDAYIKFSTGFAASLPAESVPAIAGGLPLCDENSVTATIFLDGVSYGRVGRTLAVSSLQSRSDGNETLLVLNRIGGNALRGALGIGTIFGNLYDDSERSHSFSLSSSGCQLRGILSNGFPRTVPPYDTVISGGRSGWMSLSLTSDAGLTGAIINYNAQARTNTKAFNQGRNLQRLRLSSAVSMIIPIFAPTC